MGDLKFWDIIIVVYITVALYVIKVILVLGVC